MLLLLLLLARPCNCCCLSSATPPCRFSPYRCLCMLLPLLLVQCARRSRCLQTSPPPSTACRSPTRATYRWCAASRPSQRCSSVRPPCRHGRAALAPVPHLLPCLPPL